MTKKPWKRMGLLYSTLLLLVGTSAFARFEPNECFRRAGVDVSTIKGTNCKFDSSNSGTTAYYRCDEHETAVIGCACPAVWPGNTAPPCDSSKLKQGLQYLKKPKAVAGQASGDSIQSRFANCYARIATKPKETLEALLKECKLRFSNSERTAYADCKRFDVEIHPCRGEGKATFNKTRKDNAPADNDQSQGLGAATDGLKIE